jgi:hypothetical protein
MLNTSYSKEIIKSFKPNGGRSVKKRIVLQVENKMQDFDQVVTLEVKQRKWGWHPLFHIFTTIPSLWALAPPTFL